MDYRSRLLWLGGLWACAEAPSAPVARFLVPRPPNCREVEGPLAEVLARAEPGSVWCLSPGDTMVSALQIPAGVTLWGPNDARLLSLGEGTTVTLTDGAQLLGLQVLGSGRRFDQMDAAIKINGRGGRVQGVRVEGALFGIVAEKAHAVTISNNQVFGLGGPAMGLRGDGIRLWETQDSLVENNWVQEARDLVVWYSSGNTLRGNRVRGGRYGVHFMYSHQNRIENCTLEGNAVGIFVMYSRNLEILHNQLLDARGAAGLGLGLKESGNIRVVGNAIIHNTTGIYIDTAPLQETDFNHFSHNQIRLGQVGITFHSSPARTELLQNLWADNHHPVVVEGQGDALAIRWENNYWDDYAGYDLDGDGQGDLPYELRSLSGALVARHPNLAFFHGAPTLGLVSIAGEVVPLFAPKPLMRDPKPQMRPEDPS